MHEPAPSDVDSVDSILAALYDVLSGPPGAPRDWKRFERLFHPELGRLLPVRPRPGDGAWDVEARTARAWGEHAQAILDTTGFHEREVHRITERFGHLAHVFSTYESRHDPDEREPFQRGVNSIQLLWDEQRWWILSVLWDAEAAGRRLPARYLP